MSAAQKARGAKPSGAGRDQIPLPIPHRTSLEGEDFLVVRCNSEAVRWIDLWPDWPGPALALAGPPGCGKTHLASVWSAASGAQFVSVEALAEGRVGTSDDGPFILDNAHSAMGRGACERSLFHLLNRLHGRRGRLLLTGAARPARWPVELADLASRLAAVPVAEIDPPDDELMAALLVKLFGDRQVAVGKDVIRFMATRMERSFEAARNLVEACDRRALAERRAVTIPLVRDVLADMD